MSRARWTEEEFDWLSAQIARLNRERRRVEDYYGIAVSQGFGT